VDLVSRVDLPVGRGARRVSGETSGVSRTWRFYPISYRILSTAAIPRPNPL